MCSFHVVTLVFLERQKNLWAQAQINDAKIEFTALFFYLLIFYHGKVFALGEYNVKQPSRLSYINHPPRP